MRPCASTALVSLSLPACCATRSQWLFQHRVGESSVAGVGSRNRYSGTPRCGDLSCTSVHLESGIRIPGSRLLLLQREDQRVSPDSGPHPSPSETPYQIRPDSKRSHSRARTDDGPNGTQLALAALLRYAQPVTTTWLQAPVSDAHRAVGTGSRCLPRRSVSLPHA